MFLTWCVFVMSVLRQYLVVVFRDKPLELWDIRTGTLLREMAKNFPTVTALVLKELCCKPVATESNKAVLYSGVYNNICSCIACLILSILYTVTHTVLC